MLAYTYIGKGKFELPEKPKPVLLDDRDAIVRVAVNVEAFCGDCYFCKHGWVNNCTDPNSGWAPGCRIDGGQAEYVRVPYAGQGLNRIPDTVTDRQALIERGKIDTTPLITHTLPLTDIAAAYDFFENRKDGVIKAAIQMEG